MLGGNRFVNKIQLDQVLTETIIVTILFILYKTQIKLNYNIKTN